MKTLTRTIFFVLILTFAGSQLSYGETKVYQYDGKLPFVQMMLNMMTAMGILDRLPSNSYYGNYGRSGYPSSSRYNNLQNASGALWGNPGWGVLPYESYSRNNYSAYDPSRSSDDFSGWVNESWETSDWNPQTENEKRSHSGSQETAPIVQNFNYNDSPATTDVPVAQKKKRSPLAKLAPSHQTAENSSPERGRQPSSSKGYKQSPQQKPCVTDFCGLKKPSLNGLWVAQNGEMLGVKSNRYLWSDSKSRYLTGLLKVQNEYLLASVDGHDQVMRFKYKLAGNRLLTLDPSGKVREFVRRSASQYNNVYRGGYGQNYDSSYNQ